MNVLILSFSEINRDPRVLRQIQFVNTYTNNKVSLSGLAYTGEHAFVPLLKRKRTLTEKLKLVAFNLTKLDRLKEQGFLELANVDLLKQEVKKNEIGVIIANDVETWPIAYLLKKEFSRLKLIFDAHEYYPKHFENSFIWKLMHKSYYNYLCKKYIPESDVFLTVAEGIGREYEKEFGVKSKIILNCPDFEKGLKPLMVDGENIKLIHHGIANPSRKLEKMINMMDLLDQRFQLFLILMPTDPKYFDTLKRLSKGKRIHFLDPVPTKDIPSYINQFDMGVFLLDPVNFNYEHALPNKFFEFIQARLGLAIGPSKEMKNIVEKHGLGVVSENFDEATLARKINSLSAEDIFQLKMNADKSAAKLSNTNNILSYKEIFASLNYS